MLLQKVSSAEQVADSLTKSTLKQAFVKHRDAMMGIDTANVYVPDCYDERIVMGNASATGSDGRGEVVTSRSKSVTGNSDQTPEMGLILTDDSYQYSRGDLLVRSYVAITGWKLSLILVFSLVALGLILFYWPKVTVPHIPEQAGTALVGTTNGNIDFGVDQSQWGYEVDDIINEERLAGDPLWFDADVLGT
eukprot:851982-Rhodomonas_salina.3